MVKCNPSQCRCQNEAVTIAVTLNVFIGHSPGVVHEEFSREEIEQICATGMLDLHHHAALGRQKEITWTTLRSVRPRVLLLCFGFDKPDFYGTKRGKHGYLAGVGSARVLAYVRRSQDRYVPHCDVQSSHPPEWYLSLSLVPLS